MKGNRAQRIGDQLQRELVDLIKHEIKDPRVGMITITAVDVSPDLRHAKVFFTAMTSAAEAESVREALQHAAGFLRSGLAQRARQYSVPTLHFHYDDSIETGMRLSGLIDQAVEEDRKHRKDND